MLKKLRDDLYKNHLKLIKYNLVILAWGNISIRVNKDQILIKPSGVKYDDLTPENMVLLDINGNILEGDLYPSTDTKTHLELYKAFPNINSVCHTHSTYATAFAQAGRALLPFGTTHADYFKGSIPCTRPMRKDETEREYEKNTGKIIVETFSDKSYEEIPAILVRNHGVFTWGKTVQACVEHAIITEEIGKLNFFSSIINPDIKVLEDYILTKHYDRKHSERSYYGQNRKNKPTIF